LKITPQEDPTFDALSKALLKIKKVADNINEQKRDKDQLSRILDIQASITNLPFVRKYNVFCINHTI
jgi:hypothetical protein